MQFTLPNGDHGASTNRNTLANAAVAAPPEYHSYPNGHQFHSTKRSQTTPMLGNTRGSTLTTMTGGPRSQTLQGEERLGANAQAREPSYSPHYDPPTYPLYSQGVVAPASDVQQLTVPAPPSPSYKALGKRRAASIEPPAEYDLGAPNTTVIHEGPGSPAPPYTAPRTSRPPPKGKHSKAVVRPPKAPAPRTRVMPSRQRRGTTYGIGSNPVDAMLIEAQQRAAEYVPIVDPDAVFVITTDPKGPPIAGPSTAGAQNTGKEDDRYFEREEVAENMRQQAIIQTPEFCLLSEVYQPSSRLRTRTEADVFDSSDAAYERRHRKHEMVEKRQRRREKDKLEHERYKLKERVEQLRAMDLQHFRALLPPSGGDSTQELESLRGELLAHADDLIRRYDILLPPDPRAANGQRLRLKEWEIRREGNRFIPLTDEAASELAAAGLLDEQSAAEAAAAGLLITTAGHGIPLGGKGGKGYGAGFRPDLPSSDEEEDEEGPEEDIDVAQNQEDTESNRQSSPDTDRAKSVHEDIQTGDGRQVLAVAVADELPRPSSGMLKIRLKVPRPSATPKSSDLSQDVTRSPSASAEVVPPQDEVVSVTDAPSEVPRPPRAPSEAAPQNTIPQTTHLEPFVASHPTDDYPTPAPSITSLGGALTGASNGTWTELPYHDVPYEHQPRELPPVTRTSVPPPAAPRVRTPAAATPAPVGMPVLLAVAEREANQAAGRRGRNLRTAEAFGVKLPRAFEEERDFRLPEEWLVQHMMTVDIDPSSAS